MAKPTWSVRPGRDGTCPCGSAHRLIADVQGRLDDSFRYSGDVVVHPPQGAAQPSASVPVVTDHQIDPGKRASSGAMYI
jgi:phenylacetate-coenzyme A ligase PaaK-like adenylate-forming protein